MKIYLEANSYHLRTEKVNFAMKQFDLSDYFTLDVFEDIDQIKNLFSYNLLNQPILYLVDLKNVSKLKESDVNFLIEKKASNYICFITTENTKKIINKIKVSCEFEYINKVTTKKEITAYIVNYAQIKQINIDFETLNYLVKICDFNLDLSVNELFKLEMYYQREKITRNNVNLFVRDIRQDSMFDFYKILFTKNYTQKLYYLNSFIDSNEIIPIFNGIKNYIYLAYRVKLLSQKNMTTDQIAKELGKNPYYISNIAQNISRIKVSDIEKYADKLISIDLNIKSGFFSLKKTMYELIY